MLMKYTIAYIPDQPHLVPSCAWPHSPAALAFHEIFWFPMLPSHMRPTQVLFWWPGTFCTLLCLDNSHLPFLTRPKYHLFLDIPTKGSTDFLIKDQTVNIVRFAGCVVVPVATAQLWHYSAKAVLGDINKWVWQISDKTLLAKTGPRGNNGLQIKLCKHQVSIGTKIPAFDLTALSVFSLQHWSQFTIIHSLNFGVIGIFKIFKVIDPEEIT